MSGPPHLLLTLSRDLWCELLHASLPVRLASHRFDANRRLTGWARRVTDRVRRMVDPGSTGPRPGRMLHRAAQSFDSMVHVEGDWTIDLDRDGTALRFSRGELSGAASVTARLCATVDIARGRLEIPVVVERRLEARIRLESVRYEPLFRAVVGELGDLQVDAGRGLVGGAVARLAEVVLSTQIRKMNPVVLLRRDRIEEMVGPVGGPLRLQLGVEDLDLDIREEEVRLLIRFGFHTDALCDDLGDRS